jgi:predicted RNA-binding Zn-ribbon protein involved in translation (DUF1610 family)
MDIAVQSHQPVSIANPSMRITAWQIVCFLGVIGLIWLNEVFDFQSKLFGASLSPGEWGSAVFLTIGVTLLGVIAVFPVYYQGRGAARRAVTICSYCGKVQVNERAWEKIETFCSERMHARLSHGVCPDCGERVMRDYRCGKKNAGSRETIWSDSV